jgi:hypothetical protein
MFSYCEGMLEKRLNCSAIGYMILLLMDLFQRRARLISSKICRIICCRLSYSISSASSIHRICRLINYCDNEDELLHNCQIKEMSYNCRAYGDDYNYNQRWTYTWWQPAAIYAFFSCEYCSSFQREWNVIYCVCNFITSKWQPQKQDRKMQTDFYSSIHSASKKGHVHQILPFRLIVCVVIFCCISVFSVFFRL